MHALVGMRKSYIAPWPLDFSLPPLVGASLVTTTNFLNSSGDDSIMSGVFLLAKYILYINEVYDAEVIAMLEGLKQALESPMARVAPGIHICLENLEVARNTGCIPKSSNRKVFRQSKNLAAGWIQTGKELTWLIKRPKNMQKCP